MHLRSMISLFVAGKCNFNSMLQTGLLLLPPGLLAPPGLDICALPPPIPNCGHGRLILIGKVVHTGQ